MRSAVVVDLIELEIISLFFSPGELGDQKATAQHFLFLAS